MPKRIPTSRVRGATAGGVQPPPQDRQHQQAEQELAADPDHGRQDVDEPHERPDGDDAWLLPEALEPGKVRLGRGEPSCPMGSIESAQAEAKRTYGG
jgi:hypothetical protein